MVVRVLTVDDVDDYRAIRLEALESDPGAFGSTFARESEFVEADWLDRLTGGGDRTNLVLVDEVDGEVLGTAGVTIINSDPEPMLVGMWVRASARRRGAGKRLLGSATSWTQAQGFEELVLWVVRSNNAAVALYEEFGFVPSGRSTEVTSEAGFAEIEMRLSLR